MRQHLQFCSIPPLENQAFAAVNDNIGTAVIEQSVGSWEDDGEAHSIFGLLHLIVNKITAIAEQLEKLDTLDTKIDTKIDTAVSTLQQNIEDSVQAANASYNLFVYIPKTDALADYSGDTIKITSASGNQSASSRFRDDGSNYSTTLYFNFNGNCTLDYMAKNDSGDSFDITEAVSVSATGQEFKLGSASYRYRFFLPKTDALVDRYAGEQITISNGSDSEVATLRDGGENYSTTVYANFTGSSTLRYNLLSQTYTSTAVSRAVTLSNNGSTALLSTNLLTGWSWDFVHEVCEAGVANKYLSDGYSLPDSWYIIGSQQSGSVRIWKKTNIGNAMWSTANSNAQAYYSTFNTTYADLSVTATSSGLLTYSDVTSGWLNSNRTTGVSYWLETAYSSDTHYCVGSNGVVNVTFGVDSTSHGCFPGIWIH